MFLLRISKCTIQNLKINCLYFILFAGLIFVCQEPVPETMASDCMFGLLSLELVNIRPNYEAMVRAGHLKQADTTGGNSNASNSIVFLLLF